MFDMIIKLSGSVVVICMCVLIGYCYTAKLKRRIEFLECFNHDIIMLKSRISEREKLSMAFKYVSYFSSFEKLWITWTENLEAAGIRKAFEISLSKYRDELNLTKTDIKTMLMLTSGLGKTDIKSQKEHIDYVFGMINMLCENARSEYESNCKLYRSGSVLAGILLVILLL